MTPVVNLRAKKAEDNHGKEPPTPARSINSNTTTIINAAPVPLIETTNEWDFVDEYDPQRPNEYEKLREKRDGAKEKPRERERERDRDSDRDRDRGRKRRGGRGNSGSNHNNSTTHHNDSPPPMKFSGFGQRPQLEDDYSPPRASMGISKSGGAAIAPPSSLQEVSIGNDSSDNSSNVTIPYSASSVAAKIMAKYGFRDGQGLGKQEQGMSMALQVEKTSKRGGRIIHEKDVFLPPPSLSPPPAAAAADPFLAPAPPAASAEPTAEPSITEIMKEPSKVVLLRVSLYKLISIIY